MWYLWLLVVCLAVATPVAGWVLQPAIVARRSRRATTDPCELTFPRPIGEGTTCSAGDGSVGGAHGNEGMELVAFPSIHEPPTLTQSVIVPAYNEEERMPAMLDPTIAFFEAKCAADSSFSYEIIVVDDGSKDGTADLALRYVRKHGSDKIRLLRLRPNQGKGAAIKKGMLRSRGRYLLMADADGATEIADYDRLYGRCLAVEKKVPSPAGAATPEWWTLGASIGSRAHLEKDSVAKRAFYRTVLMWGMHLCVTILCRSEIQDTQCGFKLFTRRTAALIFENLHLERWAFDIELIQLCSRFGVPMAEVAVHWQEIEGSKLIQSKLDVITTSLTMLRDMLCVRICYSFGIWRVKSPAGKEGDAKTRPNKSD